MPWERPKKWQKDKKEKKSWILNEKSVILKEKEKKSPTQA